MIHDADYQMSLSCGHDDPLNILKNSFFSCLIGIYFFPFFFEHTVYTMCPRKNVNFWEGLFIALILKYRIEALITNEHYFLDTLHR